MSASHKKIWCVVPAAGVGQRMGSKTPKQYLPFQGSTILNVTLARLQACQAIEQIVIAINPADQYWQQNASASHSNIKQVSGGAQRADSVLNAIQWIKSQTTTNDWVLVHDAARPCVTTSDIEKLLKVTDTAEIGGLLATPIVDTVKQCTADKVEKTVPREQLWRAFTPQLFRVDDLQFALQQAMLKGVAITDESSAMESQGHRPVLVVGRADNIKITTAADLPLADYIITQQQKELCE